MRPPTSVPGTFKPPVQPPGIPAQRLPSVRYFYPTGNESLGEIAQRYYGSPREAVRIFNANRVGLNRSDRSPGFLLTLNDRLPIGVPLLIP